jgi:hypothetical protein
MRHGLRRHVRLPAGGMALIGTLGAMVTSSAVHTLGSNGIQSWIVYAATYISQRIAQRDWRNDLATMGAVLAGFTALNLMAGYRYGSGDIGLWNRNDLASLIVILSTAMIARWGWWGAGLAAVSALTGSRGALIGLPIVLGMMGKLDSVSSFLKRRPAVMATAAPVAVIAVVGLVALRPLTLLDRVYYISAALRAWSASPAWGLGPGNLVIHASDVIGQSMTQVMAHNVLATVSAQIGLVGLGIIGGMSALGIRTGTATTKWKLALMVVTAILSIIEDFSVNWPVGIIFMLAGG